MCGKWRYVGGALAVALTLLAAPLEAQRGQGFRGQGLRGVGGPNMGHSVALALENQEALELTGEQVAELQDLKAVMDGDVAVLTEEIKALRESMRGGEIDREEGARQLQALSGELVTASAPLRGRVQEILTVEQHNKLQPLAWQDRPGMGRAGPGRGEAGTSFRRGGAGMGAPGQRGVNQGLMGPRPGMNRQGRGQVAGFRFGRPAGRNPAAFQPRGFFRRGGGGQGPVAPDGIESLS